MFFSRQMVTRKISKIKVRKLRRTQKSNLKSMTTKSAVNLSLRIATQFPPSNQCGRLAQAQLIYLRKMSDFFFSSKSEKLMKMNLRWMMMKKIYRDFFILNCRAISSIKSLGAPYLSQENVGFVFLVK